MDMPSTKGLPEGEPKRATSITGSFMSELLQSEVISPWAEPAFGAYEP